MYLAKNKDGVIHLFMRKPSISASGFSYSVANCDFGYAIHGELKDRFDYLAFGDEPIEVDIVVCPAP